MEDKSLAAIIGMAAVVAVSMCGCTGSDTSNNASPSPTAKSSQPAKVIGLPNPLPTMLPLGTRILVQLTGSGSQALDLTKLAGNAKKVSVDWRCTGTSKFTIKDGANLVVGSDCSASAAQSVDALQGVVPRSSVANYAWTIQADPSTKWRVVITTAG